MFACLLLAGTRKSTVERGMTWCWSNGFPMVLVWVGIIPASFSNSGLGKAMTEML